MSLRLALLLSSALLGSVLAAPAFGQQADETKVDEVVITGSQVRLPPV
jgi:iron complex outermembrane receptor protein